MSSNVNWKQRLAQFSTEVYEFRSPFDPLMVVSCLEIGREGKGREGKEGRNILVFGGAFKK